MKKILGLDLGTNSIGWALIKQDFENKQGQILGMGSRIIPMGQDIKDEFGKGNSISKTADRTRFRSIRRLRERGLLRRERLHRALNVLGFLPEHYKNDIDFDKHLGQFLDEKEPKIAWRKNSDNQFEFLFQNSFLEMASEFKGLKVPYDWTIYYLRKKALERPISKEELAWIILNFNQKRGYYQARGEDDEDATKTAQTRIYFDTQIITEIIDTGAVYKGLKVIHIKLENGDTGKYFSKEIPNWTGVEKNIIATVDLDKEGNDRLEEDGTLKRRFSIPTEDDWEKKWKLIKIKTEKEIKDSRKTVGTYIYDTMLKNPNQKIRGKLVRTIERKFYKEELNSILKKQIELQPELFTDELYDDCVRELYRSNEVHQLQLSRRDFVHLFVEDIIFYQRPLKSQKSSIGNCSLEYRVHKVNKKDDKGNRIQNVFEKDENGKDIEVKEYLKAIPKSNPYYQEFRVWQWLYNLKIYQKEDDKDVTLDFIKDSTDLENLFEFLMTQKEVNHKDILKYFYRELKGKVQTSVISKYRWNYVYDSIKDESKTYPMNKTGYEIRNQLEKVDNVPVGFLNSEIEHYLWHIIYSVNDKNEFEKALETFAEKHKLHYVSKSKRDDKNPDTKCFIYNFKKLVWEEKDYSAYSEKAIKKLLPLMRMGKYWKLEAIDERTQNRIDKIISGEFDEDINNRVREKAINLTNTTHFQGLSEWLAKYVVYGRHSETIEGTKWKSVLELEEYLKSFKQHSLRNPIVEQVVTETLRVVKDIWVHFGKGAENYFDEIHIELGREMKNTADERKRITQQVTENENTNARIKALLMELMNDSNIENVRPHSPLHQEILKLYEEYAINSEEKYAGKDTNGNDLFVPEEIPDDIIKISKLAQPTKSELIRYKLWLEQKYRSPYTGQMIPLGKLFTAAYEIEHIIPQSRYFDDGLSNKVICESAVNKLKDKQLGLEFIRNHQGEIIPTGKGKEYVRIFTEMEYVKFVQENYAKIRGKRTKLLLDEIPDQMIERQLNDTRYISKFVNSILSNIVRSENNDDGMNSKNLIPGNGKITSILRQDWGLNDVWNEIILPRFERMNLLTQSTAFTTKNREGHIIPTVPLELSKGFQKKRIDHRHHALDALVIACATKDHVNLLNNQSAKSENTRYDLQHKLRNKEKWFDKNENERLKFTSFQLPWADFAKDAKNGLERIIVSYKQNIRVINKTKYAGLTYKESKEKSNNMNWAIRQPMHEETVSGIVKLPWVKLGKNEVTTATRKALDKSFNLEKIGKITDTGIQAILKNYLKSKGDNAEIAFSPEGVEELNNYITKYNNGKFHQPLFKVRVYEKGKGRFALGEKGNKQKKYVQGAPNLFFAVYKDENGRRIFETIPLKDVIEHQKHQVYQNIAKENRTELPIRPAKGKFEFYLSPDDLVYVPTKEELVNSVKIDFENLTIAQKQRLYNVNDFSTTCYFYPNSIAKAIAPKEVDLSFTDKNNRISGSFDTKTASFEGMQIKDVCIKLKVDRLGNISK